jgi:hypothetical protein
MIFISERGLEAQVSRFQNFKVSMLPEASGVSLKSSE